MTRRVFYTLHTDLTDILEEQSDEQSGSEYIDPPAGRTVATAAQRSRPTTQPENKAEGNENQPAYLFHTLHEKLSESESNPPELLSPPEIWNTALGQTSTTHSKIEQTTLRLTIPLCQTVTYSEIVQMRNTTVCETKVERHLNRIYSSTSAGEMSRSIQIS